jgi:hypothetical protein
MPGAPMPAYLEAHRIKIMTMRMDGYNLDEIAQRLFDDGVRPAGAFEGEDVYAQVRRLVVHVRHILRTR